MEKSNREEGEPDSCWPSLTPLFLVELRSEQVGNVLQCGFDKSFTYIGFPLWVSPGLRSYTPKPAGSST